MMAPTIPSSLSRYEVQAGLEAVQRSAQPFASVHLHHSRTYPFAPNYSLASESETVDSCGGQAPLHDDDDVTVYESSSLAPSRWSDADTILGSPTTCRDRRETWDVGRHRTSTRSYQELWPSSPTSLVHTMPATPVPAHDSQPLRPSYRSPRELPASSPPQTRLATTQISAPILNSSTVDVQNYIIAPSSTSAAAFRTHSWPRLEPYCPHRSVPLSPRHHSHDDHDAAAASADDEEGIETNEGRKRARFRSRMSIGFQRILRKSG